MSHDGPGEGSAARELLRRLPRVDEVLEAAPVRENLGRLGRGRLLFHVRAVLGGLRRLIRDGAAVDPESLDASRVAAASVERLESLGSPLPRVLNATGVILHSGLGRAPLAPAAVEALQRAGGYGLLEVDREEGRRHPRDSRIRDLLLELTGAEDSLVVNNNAAATLLILRTLAEGREVVCSRGEMVEIGGSFRIPDVMKASGCRLVEVGTTNRTHTRDYAAAIGPHTGALLVVHTSNYRIMGFTSAPELEEVVALGRHHGLPVIHDLGSGSLLGPEELGLGDEPPVSGSLRAGADVVCMSGDKLLGGPQAGIILGRRELVDRMRRHALARALRIDKMTVAALEATLQLFLDADRLRETHPVTRLLTRSPGDLRPRAEALAALVLRQAPPGARAEVVELTSEAGSGALPTLQIPSVGVALEAPGTSPQALARALRTGRIPLFSRIHQERVCLDLRTLLPHEDEQAARLAGAALEAALKP